MERNPFLEAGPRARACLSWVATTRGRQFPDRPMESPAELAWGLNMLALGIALAEADREWASAAVEELLAMMADAASPGPGEPVAHYGMAQLAAAAHELIRGAVRLEAGHDDPGWQVDEDTRS